MDSKINVMNNLMLDNTDLYDRSNSHIPSVGHFDRSEAEIIIMITTGLMHI